jgi:hypothetical protein
MQKCVLSNTETLEIWNEDPHPTLGTSVGLSLLGRGYDALRARSFAAFRMTHREEENDSNFARSLIVYQRRQAVSVRGGF